MKKKIQFVKDCKVEAQGEIVQTFKSGEVYELELASAKRWLRRNLAMEVQGSVKPAATKSESPVRKKRKYTRKPPVTSTSKASE